MRMDITDRISQAGVHGGAENARRKEPQPAAAPQPVKRPPRTAAASPAIAETVREFEEFLMEIGLRF